MTPLCGCGCGEALRLVRGCYAKFRPGHFSRTKAHRDRMASVDPAKTKHIGADNGNWRGGRGIDQQGYPLVRVEGRQVREHRLIAAQLIGRPLRRGEVVHHKNGNRSDNRPENLDVLPSQGAHMRHHMTSEEARRRGANGHRFGSQRLAALAAVAIPRTDDGGRE